ncbi:MAG: cell surface protein SprA [Candidatus Zixiibacteriota bacterium]
MLLRAFFTPLLLLLTAVASQAGTIGFQANFTNPPLMISPYHEEVSEFSAALVPKHRILISDRLRYVPRVTSSDWDDRTLRLEVEVFNVRDVKSALTPVSVDAPTYMQARVAANVERGFVESGALFAKDREREGARGLGISVALPKRLDKIFGEGGAGLKVAGFRRITFAGRSQWTDAAETETFRQSKFPSLRMEQISRFDITGNIGSKITVKVSQDSQTDIPLSNRIQIRYKGDDDDILKSIEAGNTTLSLPNTKFVGYSSRIQGLFGLKAEAQVGQLKFTAIASQEKGTTESASYTATGEATASFIRDAAYVDRRVFDLARDGELAPGDKVVKLRVFESVVTVGSEDLTATPAKFYVNPFYPDSFPDESITTEGVKVLELEVEAFELVTTDRDHPQPHVIFSRSRDKTRILGYYLEVIRADSTTYVVGDISGEEYQLKLLAPLAANALPEHETWDLMWRNCYSIPVNSKVEELGLKIYKGLPNTEQTSDNLEYQSAGGRSATYLQILGLDQYDGTDKRFPDGVLDDRQAVFRPDDGLLIFPSRTPFASDTTYPAREGLSEPMPELEVKVPSLYYYTNESEERYKASQYYLQLTETTRSAMIKLNRANIIEGSETITLNGRQLARGTDYKINYDFGQIELMTDEALDPNANLNIDYEYAPFFAIQKKTLLGARAEYEWSKDFSFGSTILYKSDKTQERKPRVGQETARTVVLDGDMSIKLHPNFMTSMANAIPLVEADAPSNIAISGEVARSYPNPNVDDVAYVDDFESALEQLSLGTTRTQWTIASEPAQLEGQGYVRGKMLWHTPDSTVYVEDVYDRESAQGEGTLRILRLIYRPYNHSHPTEAAVPSWAGIMRYFGSRVDAARAQLFEVRAQGKHGRLHFDFGKISEDVIPNGGPDTEDRILVNGAVDEDEDTGLDYLMDEEEEGYGPSNPDPSGDNWFFRGNGKCPVPGGCDDWEYWDDSLYYEFLNGTEGNRLDGAVTGLPDEEILSNGMNLNTLNAYYSFVVDFASDSFLVENSERNGWVTYRIPIRDPLAIEDSVGRPLWNQVTHVRVWFESDPGVTQTDTIKIADWYFVQSNWQDSLVLGPNSDSITTKFVVAEMSDDRDKDFVPPPGVESYKDPTTNVTEAQRALLLQFENIKPGDTCFATKDLLSVEQYSGYRRMEMFVYGDFLDSADVGGMELFFRIGQDEENYYEYYTRVYNGWDERNYINIDFNEITAIKDSVIRARKDDEISFDDGGKYRIGGAPDINKVRYFAAGLANTDSIATNGMTGQIWLDELRVTEVRKDVGTAGRVTVQGNISDLINYNFSLESQDPYFRNISSTTRGGSTNNLGSGRTRTTYNYGVTLNVNKFLPRSWGARLPVTFSYDKSIETPLLRTGTDILLPEDVRQQERSIRETRRVSVTSSFNKKGRNPLFSLLLNRLNTSFSYSRFYQQTVITPYNFGETYNVRSNFDLTVTKPPAVPLFEWMKNIPIAKKLATTRLWLYPEKWTTSATFARNLSLKDDINYNRTSSNSRTFTGNMNISYRIFNTLMANYTYTTNRDLTDPDLVNISFKDPKLGLETHFGQTLTASYDPKLFSFLKMSFSLKANYTDDWQRSYDARKSVLARTRSVGGTFDHTKLLGAEKSGGRKQVRRRRDVKEPGKPIYVLALDGLRKLTGWIDPFDYGYDETYNNTLPAMSGRPSWQYRFGFKDEAEVGEVEGAAGVRTTTEGRKYNLGSGFTFLGGMVTKVKYAQSVSEDIYKQGSRYRTTSTSWPDLTIRIQKFKSFPLIKDYLNKFIDVFAPRTGYSRQVREAEDIDAGFPTSRTTSKNYKPLLSISFKVFRALSLSASYSLTEETKEIFNPTTGDEQTTTNGTKESIAATTKYSFSSPKGITLPIFGSVKFKSTVDIEVTVRINSEVSETKRPGESFVPSVDKSDFLLTPVISYTFSQQMKGGLTLRWQDSNDNYRGKKSHTREVQIWTEISF